MTYTDITTSWTCVSPGTITFTQWRPPKVTVIRTTWEAVKLCQAAAYAAGWKAWGGPTNTTPAPTTKAGGRET